MESEFNVEGEKEMEEEALVEMVLVGMVEVEEEGEEEVVIMVRIRCYLTMFLKTFLPLHKNIFLGIL